MFKHIQTTLGVAVLVFQDHHAHAPRLSMVPKNEEKESIESLLSTEDTIELIEALTKTLPPITAYDVTSRLNRDTFVRAERSRKKKG